MRVTPITQSLGAEIASRPDDMISADAAAAILAALEKHHVLVFPELQMSDDLFLDFTAALGDKHETRVLADGSAASDKGIFRIALDRDDTTQLDFIRGNDFWHMDGTAYATPGKATLLKCESAPSEGGDTGFANLYAAYDALPEDVRRDLDGARVGHCMRAVGRKLYEDPGEDDLRRWDAVFPRVEHPLVWTQANGRTALLIGSTANDIVGMDEAESRALLDRLLAWCTQDRFTYRHRWRAGDLVIFNNPALLHRSYPYTADARRVMHRTTLKGSEAITAPRA